MLAHELPVDEAARLQCLAELGLAEPPSESEPDAVLDGLVRCAAHLLGYPIALVSLAGEHRMWFKARYGTCAVDSERATSFCDQTLRGHTLFEVADAHTDPRFAQRPHVVGDTRLRAYAGLPIRLDGVTLGTLSVADTVPRRLDAVQATLLADIAAAVQAWFAHRREHADLLSSRTVLEDRAELLHSLSRETPGMLFQYRRAPGRRGELTFVSGQAEHVFGPLPSLQPLGTRTLLQRCHPDDLRGLLHRMLDATLEHRPWQHLFRVCLPGDPQPRWRSARARPSRLADGTVVWHGFVADVDEHVEVERLRREKIAAEQASAAKSAFLSRASHELRTPLNAIMGFTQLLLTDVDEPLRAGQRERVEWVLSSAQRLREIIDGLLDVDRAPVDGGQATAASASGQLTLLYIEDEPLNTLLVNEALRDRPEWRVLHAADGRTGLAIARTRRPDVVLTDINLPGMSGLDIVRELRADAALGHTLCIALSADALPAQIERAMQAGFDAYWTKPLDVLELPLRLSNAVARHAGR